MSVHQYSKKLSASVLALSVFSQVAFAQDYSQSYIAPDPETGYAGEHITRNGLAYLKDFVGRDEVITSLKSMENGFKAVKVTQPWSDTSWPDKLGSIAAPYAVSGFPGFRLAWWVNKGFIEDHQPKLHTNADNLSQEEIDQLSPAEKYDYLIGDKSFTLSTQVLSMVEQLSDQKQMALWSGVCHGWSPASLYTDRPEHSFQIKAANGKLITFYPSDVKALLSFLWGKSYVQNLTKVEGWQCKNGASVNKNGRLMDPTCFDVNPGFLHLVLANQLGLNKRGLVIDRQYKHTVYNQPVFAYKYKYYNPITTATVKNMEKARIKLGGHYRDPFKEYRSPRARSIVGVEMTLWYAQEKSPTHEPTDAESDDNIETMDLRYDLELDENDNIVGGEWREYMDPDRPNLVEGFKYGHPDIIWLVPKGNTALSSANCDYDDSSWNGKDPLPATWKSCAQSAAMEVFLLNLPIVPYINTSDPLKIAEVNAKIEINNARIGAIKACVDTSKAQLGTGTPISNDQLQSTVHQCAFKAGFSSVETSKIKGINRPMPMRKIVDVLLSASRTK